jgi:peptidoglycan biosynthesis protein MviN/MurJ (putative lipid II flippase)
MDAIPSTLDGLFVLLAGLAAWLLAGALNKYLDPRLDRENAARIKAIVSLGVLVLTTVAAYYLKGLVRGSIGGEQDFMSMLSLAFAAQKGFFMLTDSLLGLKSPDAQPDNNEGAMDGGIHVEPVINSRRTPDGEV